MGFEQNIQIKIAMSKDKLRILIKILAESHMAFDWEIKSPSLTRTLGRRHGFLHIGSLNIIKISKGTLIDIFKESGHWVGGNQEPGVLLAFSCNML